MQQANTIVLPSSQEYSILNVRLFATIQVYSIDVKAEAGP